MPEALATTKRKFNKILDSITNSSQVSLDQHSTPSQADRSTKRLRPSTSSTTLGSSYRSRDASATSLPQKTPPVPLKDGPKELPNFAPWSQPAFLERLKTFSSVSLWHPKPDALSEVHWAKRGWVCVEVNTVACKGGCAKRVLVSLERERRTRVIADAGEERDVARTLEQEQEDEDEEKALEQAIVERYKDLIVRGHAENCLWRRTGCKDDIYRLQLIRPTIWQPELQSRYHSLLHISDDIEDVLLKESSTNDTSSPAIDKLLQDLPPKILAPPSEDNASNPAPSLQTKALKLALNGWRGAIDHSNALLLCPACFQRIGLWMYQPGYHKSKYPSSSDEDEEDSKIDLLEMHREHCPWRNATSQCSSGDFAGMNASEVLWRVVSRSAKDHRRRSDGQAKAATEGDCDGADEDADDSGTYPTVPEPSKEELAAQDKERESRLKKLKRVFTFKKTKPVARSAA